MRLKLVCRTVAAGSAEGNSRRLETGELTLGRGPACGWRFRDAPPEMSKIQCRIVGDARGYCLRDESVNGVCVDGSALVEGQTVPLRDGSTIAFCGLRFDAEISGASVPDWSEPDTTLPFGDESLSITAILADVAPLGGTARGPLPGGLGHDVLAEIGARAPKMRDPVVPGWSGPPDASPLGTPIPDDWNAMSEASSATEHLAATSVRMRLPGAKPSAEKPAAAERSSPSADATAAVAAFAEASRLPVSDPSDPIGFMREAGTAVRAALEALAAMERDAADFLADLGSDTDRDRHPAGAGGIGERAAERLADQRRLFEALRILFEEWSRDFDPRRIETAAEDEAGDLLGRARRALPGAAERAFRTRYREAYAAHGGTLSGRLADALRRQELNSAGPFEELGTDNRVAGVVR